MTSLVLLLLKATALVGLLLLALWKAFDLGLMIFERLRSRRNVARRLEPLKTSKAPVPLWRRDWQP